MSRNRAKKSQVANPCRGASIFSLGGALSVTVGAAIRKNSIYDEALTVLVGGAITGALAGLVGCCVSRTNRNAPISLRLAAAIVNQTLCAAALLTAPLVGEKCLGFGADWGQTVIDELIGTTTLTVGTIAAVACCYGVAGFFSKKSPPTDRRAAQTSNALLDRMEMSA